MFVGFNRFDSSSLTVGTSAVPLPAIPTPPYAKRVFKPELIFVQSIPANTGNIVIGSSGVLSDASAEATLLLQPGDSAILPCNDQTKIYAIATAASQKLLVTYLAGR